MRTTDHWSQRKQADQCCRGHSLANARVRADGRRDCVECGRERARLYMRLNLAARKLRAHATAHTVHATTAGNACDVGQALLAKRNKALDELHAWQVTGRPRRLAA